MITLNGTPSNGTVEHALTFDGSLLHLTGSFKVNTVDLTYISESNSTTHTNYSSSVSESISFYSQSFANTHNVFTQSQIEINLGISEVSGALNRFTSSLLGQVNTISIFTASVNFTTQSLNTQTGSQDGVNLRISSTTGSINTTTSSFDSVFLGISSVTGAINTTTSSFDNVFVGISSVTGAMNTTTSSFDNVFLGISSVTGAINTTTSSFDNVFVGISSVTGAINTTTSSFDNVFVGISSVTGAMNTTTSSFDSVFLGISSVTGAINTTTSSFDSEFIKIGLTTSSIHYTTESLNYTSGALNTQTGSQNLINYNTSVWTGSVRYELNDLEAYTASLKQAIIVNGSNVQIVGELRVEKFYSDFITSSIIFVTGSNKIGDETTDKHEFTGSVNIKDTLFLAGEPLGNSQLNQFTASLIEQTNTISIFTASVNFTTQSLNIQTGSQDLVNRGISSVTGSINTTTSSFDNVFLRISSTTGSINTTTSSFDSEFIKIGLTTSSIHYTTQSLNTQTGSQDLINLRISSTTGSINTTTSSFDSVFVGISSVTGAMNTQSSSQDLVNLRISSVTGSINTTTSSFDNVFLRISSTTGSINTTTSSFDNVFLGISSVTGAMNTQSSSQDLVNLRISSTTGSINTTTSSFDLVFRGISSVTGAMNTTTSSFDNVFLRIASTTGSINTTTSSFDLVFRGISSVTGAMNTQSSSQNNINYNISVVTASIDAHILKQATQTGSQDLVNLGISTFTGSQNIINSSVDSHILKQATQTGSQDIVNFNISVVTSSIDAHILKQATQTGSQDLVNLGISTFTGSIRSEVGLIEAYTASLKGAAIVSSSTQISNYYKFAETASNNTFYGNQTISGSLNVSGSANLTGSVIINELTYPTSNFADGQYGVEVPTLDTNNVFTMEVPKTIYEYVKNDSGTTLYKGTPVHSTGTVGFNTLVIAASASNASTMPATYILAQDLDDEEEGLGIAIGAIQGVNTTGLIAGDAVYVGANGGWTQTKPTGSNLIQNLGIVTKVGNNGGGVVLGAGRSNDVPNIQQGYIWVGNKDSVATPIPTSSFELSGRGVISGSNQLPQIAGLQEYTASLKGAAIVSSSQQITNYYKFAETASANTFYGTQTISGDIKAISNTNSTLTSVQLGTAVNGTGGGNRGFDGSFIGTTNSFIGIDATDQGYGYFPATIVSGNTYTLFFKSVETNGTLGTIITSNGTNFATDAVQTLTLPSVTNGVYNIVTFTASASATHIGFAGYPTTGTITLTISEVSIVNGIADANIGKLIVQRSLVANGDSIFKGNQTITGSFNVSGSTNLTGSLTINESRIDNGWTAYTPQWTAASVNPAIGDGTIEGYYKVIGKTCFVRGNIAMGSTTTFGTGEWYVSMPFTASHADAILMNATLLDNGTAWYNATMVGARAGFNHKAPIQYQNTGGTASDVNATGPFTWATSDRFVWNGSYEIA